MIVYGASGHAKVIIEILEDIGIDNIVVWDDAPKVPELLGYPTSTPVDITANMQNSMVIAIGNNEVRKRIAAARSQFSFVTAIHPQTQISKRAKIGKGTVVMSGVSINADTIIGDHCIINTTASIDHDCLIGDYVHVSPNATLCGNVSVGEGTHIGAGSVVIQGKKIGKCCTIGAGTVVISDIPDHATVVGNPGRIIKIKNSE
ncbi:MAG: acetyltransferase [Sphingobacteriales bacterium]|nr:MAG: acetyltransferase [Sphingobacteriales bacterium]